MKFKSKLVNFLKIVSSYKKLVHVTKCNFIKLKLYLKQFPYMLDI